MELVFDPVVILRYFRQAMAPQVQLIFNACRDAVLTKYENPTHTLCYGPCAEHRVRALLGTFDWLADVMNGDFLDVDGGVLRTKMQPGLWIVENIEKGTPEQLRFLLTVMHDKAMKALILASTSDMEALKKIFDGALFNEFKQCIDFPPPQPLKWHKLVKEGKEWKYGSRTQDDPFPKGVSIASEPGGENQRSIANIAVDGKVVRVCACYNGHDRHKAFEFAADLARKQKRVKT